MSAKKNTVNRWDESFKGVSEKLLSEDALIAADKILDTENQKADTTITNVKPTAKKNGRSPKTVGLTPVSEKNVDTTQEQTKKYLDSSFKEVVNDITNIVEGKIENYGITDVPVRSIDDVLTTKKVKSAGIAKSYYYRHETIELLTEKAKELDKSASELANEILYHVLKQTK